MVMLNNQMVIYVSLVGGKLTILKNDGSSSMGRMTSHIWKWKTIQMFETTKPD